MGCCSATSCKTNTKTPLTSISLREYPRKTILSIKSRAQNSLKKSKLDDVEFDLTNPVFAYSKRFNIGQKTFWASACVIPGFDPKGEIPKTCQDYSSFLKDDKSALLVLFDGHGPEGEKVVERCGEVVDEFFSARKAEFEEDPSSLLNELTKKCDDEVLGSTKFDSYYSGCTEVLVYFNENNIHCASLGDSRAIIATTEPPEVMPAPTAVWGEDKKILDEVRKRRSSIVSSEIKAIQLTKDQKPEDPEELMRIIKSGGRVQRTVDENGNRIGPFRVWELNINAPGLAMSRSIGDGMGTRIGVIAKPICTEYQLKGDSDYFIVVASDGVWDVLDNQDVVNFVEYYRNKCRREIEEVPSDEKVTLENACIAQLLCEEARVRWFSIVEEEDVLIDDISCVILEINESQFFIGQSEFNKPPDLEPAISHIDMLEHRTPSLDELILRDPRRSSVVGKDEDLLKE